MATTNPIDYQDLAPMVRTDSTFTNEPYYLGSNRRLQRQAQELAQESQYTPIQYGNPQALDGFTGKVGQFQRPDSTGISDQDILSKYRNGYSLALEADNDFLKALQIEENKIGEPASYSTFDPMQGANQYEKAEAIKAANSSGKIEYSGKIKANYITPQAVRNMGIRFKNSEENTGGGDVHAAIPALAKNIQDTFGNRIKYVTAFNDKYHQSETYFRRKGSRNSGVHGTGRAMDIALTNPKDSHAVTRELTARLRAAGLKSGTDFVIINEYAKPSRGASGGHLDIRYPTEAAANKALSILNGRG